MHITFLSGLVPFGREVCRCDVPCSCWTQEFSPLLQRRLSHGSPLTVFGVRPRGRRRGHSASISCRCVRSKGPKKKIADSSVPGGFRLFHLPGEIRRAKLFPLWHSRVVRARFSVRRPGFSCGVPLTTRFPRGSTLAASTASAAVFDRSESSRFEALRVPDPAARRVLAILTDLLRQDGHFRVTCRLRRDWDSLYEWNCHRGCCHPSDAPSHGALGALPVDRTDPRSGTSVVIVGHGVDELAAIEILKNS